MYVVQNTVHDVLGVKRPRACPVKDMIVGREVSEDGHIKDQRERRE